jgi:hypothetical protein
MPAPAVTIPDMAIRPHDRMHASISELTPGLFPWRITLEELTRGETLTTTLL